MNWAWFPIPDHGSCMGKIPTDRPPNVIDLSFASADYLLKIGEEAILRYTDSTSVPFHIATAEGIYEVKIYAANSGATLINDNTIYLKPNNTTYSPNKFFMQGVGQSASSSPSPWNDNSVTSFYLGNGLLIGFSFNIITFTNNKLINNISGLQIESTGRRSVTSSISWNDTTIVWSSLGTLILPFSQSGTVSIKRIA